MAENSQHDRDPQQPPHPHPQQHQHERPSDEIETAQNLAGVPGQASRASRSNQAAASPSGGNPSDAFFTPGPAPEPDPQRIGAYRIIRRLGVGGMGIVYLAVRDDDQFKKRVAIKLIKRGMDSEEILRRFEQERQVLSALNHPNVARMIDGGSTPDGRPYFVMEYIEGMPIDEYSDKNRLRLEERLELFRTLCEAVHHAHQNLIVHRDIKPSNVVVTQDGTLKLLDFGIAKLLNPDMAAFSHDPTATSLRLMTPEYASPEQVRGDPLSTASDVYSLGVLLYELVTGRRPYRFKTRLQSEIERIICNEDPERPSTAITHPPAGDEAASPATQPTRKPATAPSTAAEIAKLRRRLSGDIDNIILKAMDKTPRRRYASAEQFGEDVRRHLTGMPVLARPATWHYRAGKFVRRNKTAVAAAAVFVMLIIGWGASASWLADKANRERLAAVEARDEARQQRDEAQRQKEEAQRQKEEAQRAKLLAESKEQEIASLGEQYYRMSNLSMAALTRTSEEILKIPGAVAIRGEIFKTLEDILTQLAEDATAIAQSNYSNKAMARALVHLGDFQGGARTSNLGSPERALQTYLSAVDIWEQLLERTPDDDAISQELATTLTRIADLQRASRSLDAALNSSKRALALCEGVVARNPNTRAGRRTLAIALLSHADVLNLLDRLVEADALLTRSLSIREQLWREQPDDLIAQRDMSIASARRAQSLAAAGKHDEAQREYRRTVEVRKAMLDADPQNTQRRRDYALGNLYLAQTFIPQQDWASARQHYDIAREYLAALVKDDPSDTRVKRDLGIALMGLADVSLSELNGDGAPKEPDAIKRLAELARDHYSQAADQFASLTDSLSARYRPAVFRNWAQIDLLLEDHQSAQHHLNQALDLYRQLAGGGDQYQEQIKEAEDALQTITQTKTG